MAIFYVSKVSTFSYTTVVAFNKPTATVNFFPNAIQSVVFKDSNANAILDEQDDVGYVFYGKPHGVFGTFKKITDGVFLMTRKVGEEELKSFGGTTNWFFKEGQRQRAKVIAWGFPDAAVLGVITTGFGILSGVNDFFGMGELLGLRKHEEGNEISYDMSTAFLFPDIEKIAVSHF